MRTTFGTLSTGENSQAVNVTGAGDQAAPQSFRGRGGQIATKGLATGQQDVFKQNFTALFK